MKTFSQRIYLDSFRKLWVKIIGKPQTQRDKDFVNGVGIRDFYDDYVHSELSARKYLKRLENT